MTILEDLATVIHSRRDADPDSSYVANLHAKGLNKILEKVGEEATETVIAAKDAAADPDAADAADARQALLNEVADLWFHTMVMLDHLNMDVGDVLGILEARFGTSGHDEKASRQR